MITSITIDLRYISHFTDLYHAEPVIIVGFDGHERVYKATKTAVQWAQRYIARNGGAVKVDNDLSATWYHNVDPMYTNGYTFESEFVTLRVLPNWQLKIILNDEGKAYAAEELDFPDSIVQCFYNGSWDSASEDDRNAERASFRSGVVFRTLEHEFLEDALCNGLTLDPDDDGRYWITFDAGIDDDGTLDVDPGDLGWSDNSYAVRSYVDALLERGYVIFDPYYLGETSLDDQRPI